MMGGASTAQDSLVLSSVGNRSRNIPTGPQVQVVTTNSQFYSEYGKDTYPADDV
jgi:hypothetical protein